MKLISNTTKGQEEYLVSGEMHNIKSVHLDGKETEFEVFLRLKKTPENYQKMEVTLVNLKLSITRT